MQTLSDKFREKGLRFTKPRQVIGEVLTNDSRPLSAEEIYLKVHESYPKIGLTTVYRNLEKLEQMGLVLKLHLGDGRNRYKLYQDPLNPEYHHHMICTSCKRIIDYEDFENEEIRLLRKVQKVFAQKHNFEITGQFIQFYGVCKSCN